MICARVSTEEKGRVLKICEELNIANISDYIRMLIFMPDEVDSRKTRLFWRKRIDKYILGKGEGSVLKNAE